MSLDVYLEIDQTINIANKILVREAGQIMELTREEWDKKFPDREPLVMKGYDSNEIYTANITHNLGRMADEAGIYQYLWRPDEIDIETADQLIEPLRKGLALLQAEPDRFKALNPENGWGDYEGLIAFVHDYLNACEEWPDAKIRIWR